jgi:hypothetical protein
MLLYFQIDRMEVRTEIEMVNLPIKVEPVELECEETTHHIRTEAEMHEKKLENVVVFAPKRSDLIYKRHCKVPGCTSNTVKDRNLVFHLLPNKNSSRVIVQTTQGKIFKDRRTVWLERCNLKENNCTYKFPIICSRHFTEDDYFKEGIYILCMLTDCNKYLKFWICMLFLCSLFW